MSSHAQRGEKYAATVAFAFGGLLIGTWWSDKLLSQLIGLILGVVFGYLADYRRAKASQNTTAIS
jgi:hypothetical protein